MSARISEAMKKGIKDSVAVVVAESTGGKVEEIREWLDTVNTAEDFFGQNKQGLREYNEFIRAKENEYNRAARRAVARNR